MNKALDNLPCSVWWEQGKAKGLAEGKSHLQIATEQAKEMSDKFGVEFKGKTLAERLDREAKKQFDNVERPKKTNLEKVQGIYEKMTEKEKEYFWQWIDEFIVNPDICIFPLINDKKESATISKSLSLQCSKARPQAAKTAYSVEGERKVGKPVQRTVARATTRTKTSKARRFRV